MQLAGYIARVAMHGGNKDFDTLIMSLAWQMNLTTLAGQLAHKHSPKDALYEFIWLLPYICIVI